MSAYVVDPTHIDALLSVAMHGPKDRAAAHPGDGWSGPRAHLLLGEGGAIRDAETASAAGAVLLAENIESVAYRYPGEDRSMLPGPYPTPEPDQYEFTDLGRVLTVHETFAALSGYEYQACEHPGWRESGAREWCDQFRRILIYALPGMREAEGWHVRVEDAIERASLRV